MIPYLHIGSFELPTFGLMLALAAMSAAWVMHRNFLRHGVSADALTIVATATVMGVLGAKLWHELENPHELALEMHQLAVLLVPHPAAFLAQFAAWMRAGLAWFGGLVAAIATLIFLGRAAGIRPLAMLDLSAPSAALGYAVGRIGCHLSGDGDYGIHTSLPWGVSYPDGLVPTRDTVHPTPIYEFLFGSLLAAYLWWRGGKTQPVGRLTGEYLLWSGIARFLVEFIRTNPRIYWGMSNAQVASLGSVVAGVALIAWSASRSRVAAAPLATPAANAPV